VYLATIGLIFLPCLLTDSLYQQARSLFQFVCHQFPERSFYLNNRPLPVCHRCLGVYLGGCVALLVYGLTRRGQAPQVGKTALLFCLPLVAQVALKPFFIDFSPALRFYSGYLAGMFIPLLLIEALLELTNQRGHKKEDHT